MLTLLVKHNLLTVTAVLPECFGCNNKLPGVLSLQTVHFVVFSAPLFFHGRLVEALTIITMPQSQHYVVLKFSMPKKPVLF